MRLYWAVAIVAVRAMAQTSATFSADVSLVRVPCVVTNSSGTAVTGLRPEDLSVFEDGKRQQIRYVWSEADLPLTIGLVIDISGTQSRYVEMHRGTIAHFIKQVLSPRDQAFVATVGIHQKLVTDLTGSIEQLRAGVEHIWDGVPLGRPCSTRKLRGLLMSVEMPCSSPIWDGVYYSAEMKLRSQPGRKGMLLLTDGWDMGSQHSLNDAIRACHNADTVVYPIRYFDLLTDLPPGLPERVTRALQSKRHRQFMDREAKRSEHSLDRLSTETGGRVYVGDSGNLPAVFREIEADLRGQIVLGYMQADRAKRGFRRIEVKPNRPGLTVRSRSGYWVD